MNAYLASFLHPFSCPWAIRWHTICLSLAGNRVSQTSEATMDKDSEMETADSHLGGGGPHEANPAVLAKLKSARLLVFDFDGVFTDNLVYVGSDGQEWVCCSRSDSLGLAMLREKPVQLLVLSTETNAVVAKRCEKLRLECISGCKDKGRALQEQMERRGIGAEAVAYMGNDLNDLACMEKAGVAIAPADSHPAILRMADLVTPQRGGRGAIRQVAEWILGTGDDLKMKVEK